MLKMTFEQIPTSFLYKVRVLFATLQHTIASICNYPREMASTWLQVVVLTAVLVAWVFPTTVECRIRNYKFNVCVFAQLVYLLHRKIRNYISLLLFCSVNNNVLFDYN